MDLHASLEALSRIARAAEATPPARRDAGCPSPPTNGAAGRHGRTSDGTNDGTNDGTGDATDAPVPETTERRG